MMIQLIRSIKGGERRGERQVLLRNNGICVWATLAVNFPLLLRRMLLSIAPFETTSLERAFRMKKKFQQFSASQVCLDIGQLTHHTLFFVIHHHHHERHHHPRAIIIFREGGKISIKFFPGTGSRKNAWVIFWSVFFRQKKITPPTKAQTFS